MRIGILADIHGNIYAFDKVMAALRGESCDAHCFAGDICGYYYYQNDIIGGLRTLKRLTAVAGNHDALFLDMMAGALNEAVYREKYGKSLDMFKMSVTSDSLRFLSLLPRMATMEEAGLLLCHGSPWDTMNEYVYPTDPLGKFEDLAYTYVVMGHTHYPMDRKIGAVRVLNPGSCGQPRDDNRASFAVLDTHDGSYSVKRVAYDVESMAKDVARMGESIPYLADVLRRGAKDAG